MVRNFIINLIILPAKLFALLRYIACLSGTDTGIESIHDSGKNDGVFSAPDSSKYP